MKRLIVVSPLAADLEQGGSFEHVVSSPGPVHVGRTLADVVDRFSIKRLLYFGGGSAPLLDDETLNRVIERLAAADSGLFTNNLFASDWAGVTPASAVAHWQERLPKDNMLGWVLSSEAGLAAESLPPSAASRLDIDTPGDLLALTLHPATRPGLRQNLENLNLDTSALQAALAVLATPASRVFIAGRLAPEAWSALNRVSQCWLRVVSEERGMVSSGRLARGEAYSILGDYAGRLGLAAFFDMLSDQADAALVDSRVLMAHRGHWPSDAQRYASDLGLVDQIEDAWLREFTALALGSSMPIVLGGHGLLSGDLYALCDLLR
ncbi:MAG: hypothetical protein JSW55_17555 [Chloroflexota bacterium]|nr:MAG: hypothetical protein JSW55_17555 [Chloroflexota bacterium]